MIMKLTAGESPSDRVLRIPVIDYVAVVDDGRFWSPAGVRGAVYLTLQARANPLS
jgi:hypothetical protein